MQYFVTCSELFFIRLCTERSWPHSFGHWQEGSVDERRQAQAPTERKRPNQEATTSQGTWSTTGSCRTVAQAQPFQTCTNNRLAEAEQNPTPNGTDTTTRKKREGNVCFVQLLFWSCGCSHLPQQSSTIFPENSSHTDAPLYINGRKSVQEALPAMAALTRRMDCAKYAVQAYNRELRLLV